MNRYDGDVAMAHSPDGGSITFQSGQPIMERGLFTSVYISLFTDPGWWGNELAEENQEIGSGCGALERRPLVNGTRLDYEEAARQALAWMVTSGIAKSAMVEAAIIGITVLGVKVLIVEPDGDALTFRYKINWQGQRAALGGF